MNGRYTLTSYEFQDWDGEGPQLVDFYADGTAESVTFRVDDVQSWLDRIDAGRTVNLLVDDHVAGVVE